MRRLPARASDHHLAPRRAPHSGHAAPAGNPAQLAHGERVMGAMLEGAKATGSTLIAEDLGVIPDFVRQSLTALGVPA